MSATLPDAGGEAGTRIGRAHGLETRHSPIAGADELAPGPVPAGAAPEPAAESPLEWTFNPWRQDLSRSLFGAVMTVGIMALIASFGLPLLAAMAMALAVLASVHSAILPTHCRVDGEGVARRLAFAWERRPWGAIRRAILSGRGLFVSPRLRLGVLASFQGMWLPLPTPASPGLADELRRRLALHGLA